MTATALLAIAIATAVPHGPRGGLGSEIQRVSRRHPRQVRRAARRGFLLGAAFGGVLGGVTARSNRALWMSLMAVGWGALAGGASALVALGPGTDVLYVAPAVTAPGAPSAP